MRINVYLLTLIIFFLFACKNEQPIEKEPWVAKPVAEWPDFALTNQISFTDTTFTDLANAFLIETDTDTLGVSCKHIFMVFENHFGTTGIDLGDDFKAWKLYPKNKSEKSVAVKQLINANPDEEIGQFNTLKVRDWILFELEEKSKEIYPLKIRYSPVKTNEIVYAVGWGIKQENNNQPALTKLQCFNNMGPYYYVQTLSKDINPGGRSGSPVIDKNGYLVGIISGTEGNLGVIGSVNYLADLFNQYDIDFQNTSH